MIFSPSNHYFYGMLNVSEWKAKGQYYTYQTHQVFYVDEGSGIPIVLLHGYPTASFDWQYIWQGLLANHRLIALDFLGFGFSSKPKNYPYAITNQADIVTELLRSIGIKQFHLVAHDYAVSVAQELLARVKDGTLPFTIHTVCLLNGGLFPELHRPVLTQKLLVSPLGPLVSKLFTRARFGKSFSAVFAVKPTNQELDAFWQLIQHNHGQAIIHKLLHYIADRRAHRNRWVGAITSPPVPVRLINGLEDPVSGRHLVEGYKQMVTNPNIVELPGIGHYPQIESPEKVLNAILEWIK